jgi:catechol 2,3-dioxygenase-like lactoylglutathione lyase family enzyme
MNTQKIYLEHANISVKNLDESVHFFKTAFPHFNIRGGGNETRKWIHLGDNETYIALNEAEPEDLSAEKNYDRAGINHIGFVVEDVAEIAERLLSEGFERDYPKQIEEYRIRDYFADNDGNQYEFVQYLSDNFDEKNSYA